jgi:hypothetical protein
VSQGVDDATRMLDATLTTWPRRVGWMVPDPELGLPNPHVLRAAAFQQFQIGSNEITESAYYFTDTDASGAPLDGAGGTAYRLTFTAGALPPVEDGGGYWSLTMYDEHSVLVPNPLDRYATRPDRPGFALDPGGGATITLSAERPDDVPEANWLPAPEGRFRLGLRVYYPRAAAREGRWMPPGVTRR